MEVLGIKLEGKREDVQWIKVLVPIRHVSLNRNVCGLCRCLRVGYSNDITKFPEIVLGIIKSDQVYHAHHAYHNAICSIRSDIIWDLLYGVDQRRLFVPIPRSHSPK
jgi:hypothetical protein